jgi:hypothetical protein
MLSTVGCVVEVDDDLIEADRRGASGRERQEVGMERGEDEIGSFGNDDKGRLPCVLTPFVPCFGFISPFMIKYGTIATPEALIQFTIVT